MDEAGLIEAAMAGDRSAFGTLLAPRVDRLYGLARVVLRNADHAEDALQEALVRAWRDLRSLREPERFDAWLRRLVVRASVDEARRRRRWALAPRVPWLAEAGGDLPAVDERERLTAAFTRLTPEHRAVLALRFYLDLDLADIAAATGAPLGTVKSRLHYGLEAMRAALAAEERGSAATLREGAR